MNPIKTLKRIINLLLKEFRISDKLFNDYFVISVENNKITVQSRQIKGSYGIIVVHPNQVKHLIKTVNSKILDDDAYYGLPGAMLKNLTIGKNTACLKKRVNEEIKIEMVMAGNGQMCFGDPKQEMAQMESLLDILRRATRKHAEMQIEQTQGYALN